MASLRRVWLDSGRGRSDGDGEDRYPRQTSGEFVTPSWNNVVCCGFLETSLRASSVPCLQGLAPTLKEIEELKNVTGEYCDVSTFVAFCKDVGLLLRQIRGRLLLCERSAPQNRPAHTRVSPQVVHAEDSPAKFVALFQPYDLECSGKVPMKLFKSLLLNCGEVLSEEELDAVLSRLGLDGSPLIDYREFCVK